MVVAEENRKLGEFTSLGEADVVGEDGLVVGLGIERRNGSENAGTARGPYGCSCGLDILPVDLAHAGHDIGGIGTADGRDDRVPVLFLNTGGVHGEAKGIAGGGNDAIDNGVLLVGVRPVVHGDTTRRLARNGNLARVAAKAPDVVANPLDSSSLVAESQIGSLTRGTGEAEDVDSVVDGNNDNVLGVGKVLAVVERTVGVSNGESYIGQ